jgi:DNA polymerase-4
MHQMGLFFGSDLKKLSEHRMVQSFGKSGQYYYQIVRGIDTRTVNPNRELKSVGGENTFDTDLSTQQELEEAMLPIAEKVFERFKKAGKFGRTLTLKVKFADFSQITRSKTLLVPIITFEVLWKHTLELLQQVYEPQIRVRLLGITVSNFLTEEQEAIQLEIEWLHS